MGKIKYSIIINVVDNQNLKRCIDSILNQKYDKSQIEIILEDNTKNREIKDLVDSIDSNLNIIHRTNKFKSLSEKYNDATEIIKGEYVNFIDSNYYYNEADFFARLDNLKDKLAVICTNVRYFDEDTQKYTRYKMQPSKSKIYSLKENYTSLHFCLEGYFISKRIVKKISFIKNLNDDTKQKYLFDLWDMNQKYRYTKALHLDTTLPLEDNTSKSAIQYNKWWYIDSLKKIVLPEVKKYKGDLPKYLQEAFMYLIYSKLNCNIYDRNKGVLNDEELSTFELLVTDTVKYIHNDFIIQNNYESNKKVSRQFKMPRWFIYILIDMKQKALGYTKDIIIDKEKIMLEFSKKNNVVEKSVIGSFDKETVKVYAINYKKGKLYFDCTASIRDYLLEEEIDIYAKLNGERIDIKRSEFYTLLKAFGKTYARKYAFTFSIPVLKESVDKLEIYAVIDGIEVQLNFSYAKVQARLSDSTRAFWQYKNFVLINKRKHILIKKNNPLRILGLEILFDLSKLKNVKNKKRVIKLIGLRFLYYLTKPFIGNKHIWLTWDKLYKAGDNGEYIYQYGIKNNRNIYYIIKKDAPDYPRMKKQNKKHVIVYNSLKAKLYSLHAEAILATHANVISYCGFEGISRHFACGLFNAEIICIQHGLTIQKIAQYQNRLFDNTKHYCCASQFEVDNILEPLYDYDKSQISLTGLARYDGLKTNDQRLILITPTWRRNVVNSSVAHIKKKHNNNFKNSEYFRIYNNLINNKELIECAKKNNYRITYLLHPAMSGQLEDFDKNEYVDIIPATGDMNYEKILTESSLMVTDYSGVQFDFAYQRKVLVYYHPDTLPPHYDAGGLDYETMGFGPICKNEPEIIKELCNYMNNDCQIKDEYKKRADKFFAFNDFNNCERIIKEVDKYLNSIR